MRNSERWKPSKFIENKRGDWVPNPAYVLPGSRYLCSLYIESYIRIIRTYAKGNFLDCGAGDAPYYPFYKDTVDRITCIDWSNSEHENIHLDKIVDLNQPLPYPDGEFDSILLADVLEHIYRPEQLVREMARVLKPEGTALIMVPFYYRLHENPHDYFRYTEFALTRFCEDSSLEVIELEPYGGYLNIVGDLFNKLFVRNQFSYNVFRGVTDLFGFLPIFGKINRKLSRSYPLGYYLVAKKRMI